MQEVRTPSSIQGCSTWFCVHLASPSLRGPIILSCPGYQKTGNCTDEPSPGQVFSYMSARHRTQKGQNRRRTQCLDHSRVLYGPLALCGIVRRAFISFLVIFMSLQYPKTSAHTTIALKPAQALSRKDRMFKGHNTLR